MYELRVHEDGDAEIRRVPFSHKDLTGTISTFQDTAALQEELASYGIDATVIKESIQECTTDYIWVQVK